MSSYSQIQEITFCLIFYLTHQAHQSSVWFFSYLWIKPKMIAILLVSMSMVLHSGKSPFTLYDYLAFIPKYCFNYVHIEIEL